MKKIKILFWLVPINGTSSVRNQIKWWRAGELGAILNLIFCPIDFHLFLTLESLCAFQNNIIIITILLIHIERGKSYYKFNNVYKQVCILFLTIKSMNIKKKEKKYIKQYSLRWLKKCKLLNYVNDIKSCKCNKKWVRYWIFIIDMTQWQRRKRREEEVVIWIENSPYCFHVK